MKGTIVAATWATVPTASAMRSAVRSWSTRCEPRVKRAAREQHGALRLAVGDDIGDVLECGTLQPAVAALHDVERQVRQAEPAPLILELFGRGRVDVEMHHAQLVRSQACARTAPRAPPPCRAGRPARATTWRCRTGASAAATAPVSSCFSSIDVLPVQADQPVVHRWSDHRDDPRALEELGDQQDADDRDREHSREPVDHRAEAAIAFARCVRWCLSMPNPANEKPGEDADRVETDQRS